MPFFHDANEEIRDLNRYEKNVVYLTIFGAFFASFDFTIYFYFNDSINQAFFPENIPESLKSICFLLLILAGYMSRPLGGLILGDIGDRYGRKHVLLYSLLLVGASSLVIACLPTYHHIGVAAIVLMLLLRLIQGFGYGAEVPASWVYIAEHMPRRQLGSVCGGLISALILSTLMGNILSSTLSNMLTPTQMQSYGWRIPFVLASIGTLFAVLLRAKLEETPLWLMAKSENRLVKRLPIRRAIVKYRYGTVMTLGLSWFTASVYLTIYLLLPILGIQFFDIDTSLMMISNGVGIIFGGLGALTYGYFADRFNSGRVFTLGCIFLSIASVVFFVSLKDSSELLLINYAILGFFSGVIGLVPSICVRLFPVGVRLSGISFTYNLAYALAGALLPVLLIYFSRKLMLSSALYLVFVCVIGIIMGMLLTNLHGLYRMEDKRLMNS